MTDLIAAAENDEDYTGYLILTVREGDVLVIGDSVLKLKSIKSLSKASIAVMAKRHVLVRKLLPRDTARGEVEEAKV